MAAKTNTVVLTGLTAPKRGGVSLFDDGVANSIPVEIAWTGGGLVNSAFERTTPYSISCYRYSQPDKAMKIEEACKKPMEESRRLGLVGEVKQNGSTLVQWIQDVGSHMQSNGMDGVFIPSFPAVGTAAAREINLLKDWTGMNNEQVLDWFNRTTRANDFDDYDSTNMRLSAQYLRASVTPELWTRLRGTVKDNEVGPLIFVAAVQEHQQSGTQPARVLVRQIEELRLSQVPGEDVTALSNKIYDICARLEGAGSAPVDLALLVATCFLKSETQTFSLAASLCHDQANRGTMSWQEVLATLRTKYMVLKESNLWDAVIPKEDSSDIKALKAEVAFLKRSQENTKSSRPSSNSTNGSNGKSAEIECFKCGKKGHYARDCKSKDKKTTSNIKKFDWKEAPKAGEPNSKTHPTAGAIKWCGTCGKWRSGKGAHLTTEHRVGAGTKPSSNGSDTNGTTTSTGHVAAVAETSAYLGGLHMQGFH